MLRPNKPVNILAGLLLVPPLLIFILPGLYTKYKNTTIFLIVLCVFGAAFFLYFLSKRITRVRKTAGENKLQWYRTRNFSGMNTINFRKLSMQMSITHQLFLEFGENLSIRFDPQGHAQILFQDEEFKTLIEEGQKFDELLIKDNCVSVVLCTEDEEAPAESYDLWFDKLAKVLSRLTPAVKLTSPPVLDVKLNFITDLMIKLFFITLPILFFLWKAILPGTNIFMIKKSIPFMFGSLGIVLLTFVGFLLNKKSLRIRAIIKLLMLLTGSLFLFFMDLALKSLSE